MAAVRSPDGATVCVRVSEAVVFSLVSIARLKLTHNVPGIRSFCCNRLPVDESVFQISVDSLTLRTWRYGSRPVSVVTNPSSQSRIPVSARSHSHNKNRSLRDAQHGRIISLSQLRCAARQRNKRGLELAEVEERMQVCERTVTVSVDVALDWSAKAISLLVEDWECRV